MKTSLLTVVLVSGEVSMFLWLHGSEAGHGLLPNVLSHGLALRLYLFWHLNCSLTD